MTSLFRNKHAHPRELWWFLGAWTFLNLIQGYFSQLAEDEGYYWMWSQYPAIGYFDHPPMVAMFIKAGYTLIKNELGVRLVTILASTGVLYMLYRMLGAVHLRTLAIIAVSTLLVHVGGIFAAPDSALIFFVTLFLLIWKRYLEEDSWPIAILAAIVMACVMYSKYHGVFILFFTVVANPRIWLRPTFWFIIAASVALYVPHIIWMFGEGYPSIEYNMEKRITDAWNPVEIFGYIGGQLAIAGPFVGFITFYAAFRQPAREPFVRAMKSGLIGVFGIFFLLSLRGHIEANWTASGFIPLIYLSVVYIDGRPKLMKWLEWLAIPSVLLILLVRIQLFTAIINLPPRIDKTHEFRGWRSWAQEVKVHAGDNVLAGRTFQDCGRLTFYTGELVPSILVRSRKDQYLFWRFDRDLEGQTVTFMSHLTEIGTDTLRSPKGTLNYFTTLENFRTYNDVEITSPQTEYTLDPGEKADLVLTLKSPERWDGPALSHNNTLSYDLYDGEELILSPHNLSIREGVYGEQSFTLTLEAPERSGTYLIQAYLRTEGFTSWNWVTVGEVIVR